MALSASQILKAHKEKSNDKKSLKPSFTTINLHKGRHSSGFYKTLLKDHLMGTQNENHTLSSASRQYQNQTNKKFRSRSVVKKDENPTNPEMIRSDLFASKNKEHDQVFQRIFQSKAQRVPQIQDTLRDQIKEKAALQQHIKQLRLMINNEGKTKTKVNINCNKMMNQIERLTANTNKVREENFNLNIQIIKHIEECNQLQVEVNALNNKIEWTRKRINEEKKLVQDYQEYNKNTQIALREQTKHFNFMKETESKAIKNMSSNYMYQNQLKEEKALLLASIEKDFNRNQ